MKWWHDAVSWACRARQQAITLWVAFTMQKAKVILRANVCLGCVWNPDYVILQIFWISCLSLCIRQPWPYFIANILLSFGNLEVAKPWADTELYMKTIWHHFSPARIIACVSHFDVARLARCYLHQNDSWYKVLANIQITKTRVTSIKKKIAGSWNPICQFSGASAKEMKGNDITEKERCTKNRRLIPFTPITNDKLHALTI